jgi:hypothetical protein
MKRIIATVFIALCMFNAYAWDTFNNYNSRSRQSTRQNYDPFATTTTTYRTPTYDNSRSNPYPYTEQRTGSYGQTYYVGPKGGEYYINSNSNRTYYNSTPNYSTPVYQGERGGNYYYNRNGNKIYIRTK